MRHLQKPMRVIVVVLCPLASRSQDGQIGGLLLLLSMLLVDRQDGRGPSPAWLGDTRLIHQTNVEK